MKLIWREFGLDKCARIVLRKGRLVSSLAKFNTNFSRELQVFEQGKTYKYVHRERREGGGTA
jgi:hypothetical protein